MVAVPSIGRATQVTPRRAAPEADATRDLYERYARQIYSYCLHQLGNREEAEDATQSTFLNAFRGIQRGVDPEFESAWLYKIAQNVCLTRQRSSSRRRRVETPGDLEAMQDYVPAHQADSDELIHLPEALESMPEQQRRALLLREWQGLSYKEIADELDLSQAAVETLLFRARRSLASGLVEAPPKKTSAAKRLRRSSDAGSVLAIVKSILFTGGVKVAATVATVAATSVVAATPVTRHAVEDVVTPGHDRPAPAHVRAKPAAKHLASAAPVSLASKHSSSPSAGSAVPATHATRAKPAKHHSVPRRMHKAAAPVSFIRIHSSRTTVEPAALTAAAPPAPAPAAPVAAAPAQVEPTPPPAVTQPPAAPPVVDKQRPAVTEPSTVATPGEQSKKDDAKKDDAKSTDAARHDGARSADGRAPGKSNPQPSSPTGAATPSTPSATPKSNDGDTPTGGDQRHGDNQNGDKTNRDGRRSDRGDRPSTPTPENSVATAPVAQAPTTTTSTQPVAVPPAPAATPVQPTEPLPAQSDKGDRGDRRDQGQRGDGQGEGHRK